jgi:hypothetical protein
MESSVFRLGDNGRQLWSGERARMAAESRFAQVVMSRDHAASSPPTMETTEPGRAGGP